jgi:CheY-like chemotaxis protein
MSAVRILVIDDHAMVRDIWCDFLATLGYQVDAANEGTEGLRLFARHAHNLVLTDLRMAGMDGWEVAERVRRHANTPVILITGSETDEEQHRAESRGFVLLQKPVGLPLLKSAVLAALAGVPSDPISTL